MSFKPIIYRKKHLTLHKAIINPNFNTRIVLASNPWEYVDMWLKRRGKNEALFFWRQANSFYNSSLSLTRYSVPLTAYYYINGSKCLWYIKQAGNQKGIIERSSLTLQFAAMHRLSEMVRYEPMILTKPFRGKHNWLLSEFVTKSLNQYVDEISAEITGAQIMIPGIRS